MAHKKESNAIPIADYMSNKPVTMDSHTTAFEITNRMLQKPISVGIVMDSAKPVGILTERDVTREACAKDSPT